MNLRSIQARIGLYIFTCSLVISCVLVATSIVSSDQILNLTRTKTEDLVTNLTEASLEAETNRIATMIGDEVLSAQDYVSSLAISFEAVKKEQSVGGIGAMEMRQLLNSLLAKSLESHPSYTGIFSVWEPNVLGGADKIFRHQPGHNKQGRFAPYWSYTSGELSLTPLNDFENTERYVSGDRLGEYYLCAKESLTPCFIQPHQYVVQGVETLVSAISAPIVLDDKFYGVVGLNLNIEQFNTQTKQLANALFDGSGSISLLTKTGFVIASSNTSIANRVTSDPILIEATENNQVMTVNQNGTLVSSAPIHIKDTNTTWHIVVQIDEGVVFNDIHQLEQLIVTENDKTRVQQVLIAAIVGLVCVFITYLLSKKIVSPIRQTVGLLAKVADGNLTERASTKTNDETRQLANACNQFLDKTQPVIQDVSESTKLLSQASDAISNGASENKLRIEKQQEDLSQLSTASSEMASTSAQLAEIAHQASEAAVTGNKAIHSSKLTIEQLKKVTDELANDVTHTTEVVTTLSSRSQEVCDVMTVIESIAEQTNLLALNAAIEAARAGEQGRGFAVVADEVRSLAMRTQNSTQEIGELLISLQADSDKAVKAMANSQQKVSLNLSQVEEVSSSLLSIHESVDTIGSLNDQVATVSEEQSAVAAEINLTVSSVSAEAASVAIESEKSESLSQELEKISHSLSDSVSVFKV
ncbi:methyl-accepting chemotaxis protein [Vibrio sp. HN007]|uniref:methyl-accepting chemotaxis protein n=1 Tax=Vibrio iocasae TaxID=3098914 RepID=UPI0035D45304